MSPALFLTLVTASGVASAQAPENVAIVGTLSPPSGTPGTTGVFYVELPTATSPGGRITPLAPLPPELTIPPFGGTGGAAGVLYRPSDGTLFVGDAAGANQWNHIHILELAGAVVIRSRKVRLGQLPNIPGLGIGVSGLALLPDGRVVIASVNGYIAGPMSASPIAILDDRPTTPTVTPVMLDASVLPRRHQGGLAVSPNGTTAYFTNQGSLPNPAPVRLYSVDLTQTGTVTPVLLHSWPDRWVTNLTTGPDGVVYGASHQPAATNPTSTIEEITIRNNAAAVKSVPATPSAALLGIALDRVTGGFVLSTADFGNTAYKNSVLIGDRLGNLTPLTGPRSGGWGMVSSVDIHNAFGTYGTGTPGANHYSFAEFPNPGGLPEVGNAGFSLTVQSTPGAPSISFLVLGTKPADRPFLGIRLLVDLGRPHMLLPMTAAPSASVALPIPNNPVLRGTVFHAQSAHADSGSSLATSNGVSISIK